MGFITIAEVLERVDEFEHMLAEFYAHLSQAEWSIINSKNDK